jgi:DnaJ-class molecular chaperone
MVCDLALLLLGTGVKPGAKVKSCGTCGGQGAVNNVQRTPFGVFSNVQPCPKCGGSGEEVEEHCGTCRGQGQVAETKEVTLKIPAGVESGSTMRLRDGGNAGETAHIHVRCTADVCSFEYRVVVQHRMDSPSRFSSIRGAAYLKTKVWVLVS